MQYYDLFRKKEAGEHDLRIATIFTYGSNEDSDEKMIASEMMMNTIGRQNQASYKSSHSRDKLKIRGDCNDVWHEFYDQR
jgi:type I restriction enzyme R subunit